MMEPGALADLRGEGVYPFGPMPDAMARAWAPIPAGKRAEDRVREAAYLRERKRFARGEGVSLRDRPGDPLGTPTGIVAALAARVANRDAAALRRERFRLRAAAQEVVEVRSYVAERVHYRPDESGELRKIKARKVVNERLGQKVCGRAVGVDVPEKGASQEGRRVSRAGGVSVVAQPDGRATLRGTYRCGSVWCCPVCAYHIARERGDEVATLVGELERRGASAYLLTLTVRHWRGMDLKGLRAAVSGEWRKVRQLRRYREALAGLGYLGDVRALEVTHGENGWHPHLHVLVWFKAPLSPRGLAGLRRMIRGAWCDRIEAATGARPSRRHGVDLRPVKRGGDYLNKLGLGRELTSAHGKEGREGRRTHWQILRDWATYRRGPDADLWAEWAEGIHGARQLTYSGAELRDLRRELVGEEESDAALAEREAEGGVVVAEIPAETWGRLERALPAWALWVVESAERYGGRGLVDLVRTLDRELIETGRPPPWWKGWGGGRQH